MKALIGIPQKTNLKSKDCTICKKTKPIEEFVKQSTLVTGYKSYCKQCQREYNKSAAGQASHLKYRKSKKGLRNIKKTRATYRTTKAGKQKQAEYSALYWKKYPERVLARQKALFHIRRKNKVGPCETCGAKRVDMHHEDYSKPLDVKFLCRKHHSEIHR